MKKLYFVQPNTLIGNSIYYPYAVGVIASYALQFDDISSGYELSGIIFKEDNAEDVLSAIENPSVVGFSNYFWNYEYNLKIAELIKEKYPECVIIFGGHQISRDSDFLEKYKYIDILIFGEGEIPLLKILRSLLYNHSFEDIANIAFRSHSGEIIKTSQALEFAESYPSPYTSGIFDKLCNVSESIEFNAQLETNRGCPYHCSFCDWCDYDLPIRLFSLSQIKSDLEWISEHKVTYCMCIDSNFGLYERDEEIAEYAALLKNKNGYPQKFGACFAKNKTDRIFRINKLFNDNGMSKGVSLAFQSMSEEVLRNVSRKNMNNEKLTEQLILYHKAGIPTYTELILGLPGETLESFSQGICKLLEFGQHDAINVFRCEVYPNSRLSEKDYMEKFKIRTATNKLNLNHCKKSNAVFFGGLEYIVETSTMTSQELIDANLFAVIIQSVHCRGLLQCAAIYLRIMRNIAYFDFYNTFINYFSYRSGVIGDVIRKLKNCISSLSDENVNLSYLNDRFGDITWPFDEAMLLDYIYSLDEFYEEVRGFIKLFENNEALIEELLKYQKALIVTPTNQDVTLSFSYDWWTFFKQTLSGNHFELVKAETKVLFSSGNAPTEWEEYAKQIIWYGRRNKRTIKQTKKL